MRAELHDDPSRAQPPDGPNEPINEDIYCLTCGYNLRGLYGDPVRCPECGNLNDLGTAGIPAGMIHEALRSMETAPTLCTGFAFVLGWVVWLVLVFRAEGRTSRFPFEFTVVLAVLFAISWIAACAATRRAYRWQSGWKGVLFDFHRAVFLCTLLLPSLVVLWKVTDRREDTRNAIALVCVIVVCIPLFLWGLRIYRAAQARLAIMLREEAVRIGRKTLREELHRQRYS